MSCKLYGHETAPKYFLNSKSCLILPRLRFYFKLLYLKIWLVKVKEGLSLLEKLIELAAKCWFCPLLGFLSRFLKFRFYQGIAKKIVWIFNGNFLLLSILLQDKYLIAIKFVFGPNLFQIWPKLTENITLIDIKHNPNWLKHSPKRQLT